MSSYCTHSDSNPQPPQDLLGFAENLDIDKYMDDYEFSEALAAAKAHFNPLLPLFCPFFVRFPLYLAKMTLILVQARINELDSGDEAEAGDEDDGQRTVGHNSTLFYPYSTRFFPFY